MQSDKRGRCNHLDHHDRCKCPFPPAPHRQGVAQSLGTCFLLATFETDQISKSRLQFPANSDSKSNVPRKKVAQFHIRFDPRRREDKLMVKRTLLLTTGKDFEKSPDSRALRTSRQGAGVVIKLTRNVALERRGSKIAAMGTRAS